MTPTPHALAVAHQQFHDAISASPLGWFLWVAEFMPILVFLSVWVLVGVVLHLHRTQLPPICPHCGKIIPRSGKGAATK